MSRPETNPTATLLIPGASGGAYAASRIIKDTLQRTMPSHATALPGKGVVNIYCDYERYLVDLACRQVLAKMAGVRVIHHDRAGPRLDSQVTQTEPEPREAQEDGELVQRIQELQRELAEQKRGYEEQRAHLVEERDSLRMQCNTLTDSAKDADALLEENIGLGDKVKQQQNIILEAESSVRGLQARVDALSRQAKISATTCNGHILGYLSMFADRLRQVEDLIGRDIYTEEAQALDKLVTAINQSQIGITVADKPQVIDVIARYFTHADREANFKDLYRNNNEASNKVYQAAISDRDSASKVIAIFEAPENRGINDKVRGETVQIQKQTIERCEADIKRYEEAEAEFVQDTLSMLSVVNDALGQEENLNKVKEQVAAKSCTELPIYIDFADGQDNYVIRVYLPQKSEENSRICNVILSEDILARNFSRRIDKDTFQQVAEGKDDAFGLRYFEIPLPKAKYNLGAALGIIHDLEAAVASNYVRTGLCRFGISIKPMFGIETVLAVDGNRAEDTPEPIPRNQGSAVMVQNRTSRREALVQIASEHPDTQYSIGELIGMIRSGTGLSEKDCPRDSVRYDLQSGIVQCTTVGKGRSIRYSLRPNPGMDLSRETGG